MTRTLWLAGLALALACGADAPARAGDPVTARFAALAEEAEARGDRVLRGEDGFLFLVAELRHLGLGRFWGDAAPAVSRAQKPEWADPLPAILDFARQLEGAGIDLLFVPVPAKASVVPGAVPELPASPRPGAADAAFFETLRDAGLQVLDLAPVFASQPAPDGLECRTDTHWSGRGAELAAAEIARRVRERDWYGEQEREEFASETREVAIDGDLRKMLGGDAPEETLPLRFVGRRAGGRLAPVEPRRESPLLLLADSHGLVFHAGADMHARGAGLPDQLALELGFPVDLLGVRGSGATPSRMALARRRGGLAGKRMVVWVLTVREFTESSQGWREVPVVR